MFRPCLAIFRSQCWGRAQMRKTQLYVGLFANSHCRRYNTITIQLCFWRTLFPSFNLRSVTYFPRKLLTLKNVEEIDRSRMTIYHGSWLVRLAVCRTKVKTDGQNLKFLSPFHCNNGFFTATMPTRTHLIVSFIRTLSDLFLYKIYGDGFVGLFLCKLWMRLTHNWDILSAFPHVLSS
jgi:hypothetical protein